MCGDLDPQPIGPEPTADILTPPGNYNVLYLVKYTSIDGCYREIVISTEYGPGAAVGLAAATRTDWGALISVGPWDGSPPPDRAPEGYPC